MSHNQPHNIRRIFAVGQRFFSAFSFRYPKGSRKDRRCGFRFSFPFQLYRVPLCSRAAACLRLRATTLSFSRPTAAPDWAHVFLGSTAEQGPSRRLPRAHSARKRAGICPQHEAGNWSLPQVSQTLTEEFKASEWSFRQVLFKLCNWGARLSSCSTE